MNLGQKTLLVVSLTVAGVMTVLYAVGRDVLMRSYLELEREQTRSAVARTEAALDDQINNLTRSTNDYGEWDRTYAFMQHPSQGYIKQEFENDTLQGLQINSVLLAEVSRRVVFFKAYDSVANLEVQVPSELQSAIAADPWVQQAMATSTPAHGILLLPQGPVLIAACPILTTARRGPVRGVLVMTRNLDATLVEGLRERTLLPLAINLASSLSLPVQAARRALESTPEKVHVQAWNQAFVAGSSLLRDVHGQAALLVQVEMPRSVFQRGLTSLRYLLATLCIAGLVFGGATLLLLRHIVLARLTHLSAEVGRIGSGRSKDLSERILVPGGDEIGRLGRDINRMLGALQKNADLERMNEVLRQEIKDRQLAETERNQMAVELLHGQKLQAVGALAAGVAHEINTPIQFVGDNVRFLHESFAHIAKLLERYEALYQASCGHATKPLLDAVDEARQRADLEFLRKEIPVALGQSLDGIGRIATIVRALKNFSHVDSGSQQTANDLNAALESTLVVARNEFKYLADVETAFGDLPLVVCYLGDLNQVFLNLMLNAAHSIADVVKGTDKMGSIRVETRVDSKPDGDWAEVSISDTGTGIPEAVRERIFEPFFTTKPVGKGTGQGLALARAIVVEKHGGSLTFETEMGRGTTFHVRIPVNGIGTQAARAAGATTAG
ncbi:MAG: CHASE4 domain-containing protein [Terriglobales bacterium]|jgi:two-component system, NtrC family, sensor kinase